MFFHPVNLFFSAKKTLYTRVFVILFHIRIHELVTALFRLFGRLGIMNRRPPHHIVSWPQHPYPLSIGAVSLLMPPCLKQEAVSAARRISRLAIRPTFDNCSRNPQSSDNHFDSHCAFLSVLSLTIWQHNLLLCFLLSAHCSVYPRYLMTRFPQPFEFFLAPEPQSRLHHHSLYWYSLS